MSPMSKAAGMSKAAKRRRFLKWAKYQRQCTEVTKQHVPRTMAANTAWVRAVYRIQDGKFYAMPPWRCPDAPIGNWERYMWDRVR